MLPHAPVLKVLEGSECLNPCMFLWWSLGGLWNRKYGMLGSLRSPPVLESVKCSLSLVTKSSIASLSRQLQQVSTNFDLQNSIVHPVSQCHCLPISHSSLLRPGLEWSSWCTKTSPDSNMVLLPKQCPNAALEKSTMRRLGEMMRDVYGQQNALYLVESTADRGCDSWRTSMRMAGFASTAFPRNALLWIGKWCWTALGIYLGFEDKVSVSMYQCSYGSASRFPGSSPEMYVMGGAANFLVAKLRQAWRAQRNSTS